VNAPILLLTSFFQEHAMTFAGDLDFKQGRSPSQTTTILLERCLGCARGNETKGIGEFLEGLLIKPSAFFKDISGDWVMRPFLGRHVFKVLQAAGYEGTEHDLWYSVTGRTAPYKVTKPKAEPRNRSAPKATGTG
jgi:hypothetical protein